MARKDNIISELLRDGFVDVDAMSGDELDASFDAVNEQMRIIYLFVLKYNDYINTRQNYAKEEALTMLEAHLLTDVCDKPGSTVTSLATSWERSISATSQTIRKLIKKELITRENSKDDAKVFYLKPTPKGIAVSETHKRYDVLDVIKTLKSLLHTLKPNEIKVMFKALKSYSDLMKKNKANSSHTG